MALPLTREYTSEKKNLEFNSFFNTALTVSCRKHQERTPGADAFVIARFDKDRHYRRSSDGTRHTIHH